MFVIHRFASVTYTAHIQQLVRLLKPTQLEGLKAGPKLRVKLTFTTKLTGTETDNCIKDWSNFCESEGIGAVYEVDETEAMATVELFRVLWPRSDMASEEKHLKCVLVMPVLVAVRQQIDKTQQRNGPQLAAFRAHIGVLEAQVQAIRAMEPNGEVTGGGVAALLQPKPSPELHSNYLTSASLAATTPLYNTTPTTMVRTSRLLALPREMRDMIYEFTVIGEHTLRIKQNASAQTGFPLASSSGLLLACSQLSSEYFQAFTKTALRPNDSTVFQVTFKNLTSLSARRAIENLTEEQLELIQDGRATKLIVKLFFTSAANNLSPPEIEKLIETWTYFCSHTGLSAGYWVADTTAAPIFWDDFREEGRKYRKASEGRAVCDAIAWYFAERETRRHKVSVKRREARAIRAGKLAVSGAKGSTIEGQDARGLIDQAVSDEGATAAELWSVKRLRSRELKVAGAYSDDDDDL
ncbi:hypothetical protein LTR17_013896 [Elasticomyces elasticus]|nr:hypothetical protein LTR17_013896 [Elasticomyces elasticus]